MGDRRFRNLNITIVFLSLICIGTIVWGVISYAGSRPAVVSAPLLSNVFLPDSAKNGSIRYYNGNTFLQYNLATQKLISLVPDTAFHIENIKNIFWLENGAVFNTSSIPAWSPLFSPFNTVINPPIDPAIADIADSDTVGDDEVYWFVSFKDGSIKPIAYPIPSNISQFAQYTTDNTLLFWDIHAGYSTIDGNGVVQPGIIGADGGTLNPQTSFVLFIDRSYVYYLHTEDRAVSLNKIDRATHTRTIIKSNIFTLAKTQLSMQAIPVDDSHVLITSPEETVTNRTLILLNLLNGQQDVLAHSFSTPLIPGAAITAVDGTRVYFYQLIDGKLVLKRHIDDTSSRPVAAWCEATRCYYNDTSGQLRIASDDEAGIPNSTPSPALEKIITSDQFSLSRNITSPYNNEYLVTFDTGTPQDVYKTLRVAIEQKNINPDLFTFILNPGRGVQY